MPEIILPGELATLPTATLPSTLDLPEWATRAVTLLLADKRSEETQRAYKDDIRRFFTWCGREDGPASIVWLCNHDTGALALLLNGWKASLMDAGKSEATVNRRLSAIKSLLLFARRIGAPCPDPRGLVSSEKVKTYRDTRGPGVAAVLAILEGINTETVDGKRDYALIRLMFENGLRRGEVVRLSVGDFEPTQKRVWILGKGRGTQKEAITLSASVIYALDVYLAARREGGELLPGESPLFCSYGRGAKTADDRLTGNGLWRIINRYGLKVLETELHPHQIRHSAITAVLDATDGNLRTAQRFSRHRNLNTLLVYDDSRQDLQGEATGLLSDLLQGGK